MTDDPSETPDPLSPPLPPRRLTQEQQATAPAAKHPVLTVTEMVYHQLPNEQPYNCGNPPWSVRLTEDEAPYCRPSLKVSAEPKALDLGWLAECPGMLYLRNVGEVEVQIVKDAGEGSWVVADLPPGESARFRPSWKFGLLVRTAKDGEQGKLTYTVFPR